MPHLDGLLVITGANGHVGFSVVLAALRAEKRVRAVVRSEVKIQQILSNADIKAIARPDTLSFAVVADITRASAFKEAFRDATEIIHTASPIPNTHTVRPEDYHEHFVSPAVFGTLAVLRAAAQQNTVQRVVITSSIVALVPIDQLEGQELRLGPVRPWSRTTYQAGPYGTEFRAYAASKVAALLSAERWRRLTEPPFDVVHLHPSFVTGRKHLANTERDLLLGSNSIILGTCLGHDFSEDDGGVMRGFIGASVHIDDVAQAHIRALHPDLLRSRSYILSQPARWEDIKTIIAEEFPDAVRARMLVLAGRISTITLWVDAEDAIIDLGMPFRGFQEQVAEVVGQYLELRTCARVVYYPFTSRGLSKSADVMIHKGPEGSLSVSDAQNGEKSPVTVSCSEIEEYTK